MLISEVVWESVLGFADFQYHFANRRRFGGLGLNNGMDYS